MNFGVLKDERQDENRVALTPMGVAALIRAGHWVCVESGAGKGSSFSDEDYSEAGATLYYSAKEVIGRSNTVLSVQPIGPDKLDLLQEEQIIACYWQLVMAKKETVQKIMSKRVTCLGFEMIEDKDGRFPVVWPMSEIAGELSASVAQYLLQDSQGGRGVLLGGGPGVPSASVVIIGGGVVGRSAARAAIGLGAQVMVMDNNTETLRWIHDHFSGRAITSISTVYNIKKAMTFADVVIGAVSLHGERTPILITADMIKLMRPRSLFMDISIDFGGISETSRPTTLTSPTYEVNNVIHYCVPNMSSGVPRTATHALTAALLPHLKTLGEKGFEESFIEVPEIHSGTYIHKGNPLKPWIREYFQL